MNQTTKRYLIGMSLGFVVIVGTCALAFAMYSRPMVIQVDPNGGILLRGTITSINSNSLNVKSWGGEWLVNTSSSTQFLPGKSISQFAVGDFVGIKGIVSTGSSWTIDATLVRDWTVKKIVKNSIKDDRYYGIVSNIKSSGPIFTFSLNSLSGTTYNVTLANNAQIIGGSGLDFSVMNFSAIKNGDSVYVSAVSISNGNNMVAGLIRDVSLKVPR